MNDRMQIASRTKESRLQPVLELTQRVGSDVLLTQASCREQLSAG